MATIKITTRQGEEFAFEEEFYLDFPGDDNPLELKTASNSRRRNDAQEGLRNLFRVGLIYDGDGDDAKIIGSSGRARPSFSGYTNGKFVVIPAEEIVKATIED